GKGWNESPQPFMADSPSTEQKLQPSQPCAFDAGKLELKLRVTLAGDRDAVDTVVRSVMTVVREMNCAPGREDHIELALTEALANAVVHGAKSDPSKIIECDVACDAQHGILIVVRDPAQVLIPARLPILAMVRTSMRITVVAFT